MQKIHSVHWGIDHPLPRPLKNITPLFFTPPSPTLTLNLQTVQAPNFFGNSR